MVGKSRLPVALFFYCKNIFDFVILSRFPVVENKIVILRPGLEKVGTRLVAFYWGEYAANEAHSFGTIPE